MNSEEIISTYIDAYNYYLSHTTSRPRNYLLIQLDKQINPILDELYLNNYEISEWEGFFLKLWSGYTEQPYMPVAFLLTELNLLDVPFLSNFFAPRNGALDVNDFIEFVCIFGFYPSDCMFPIALSICGVNSNRIISDSKVISVLKCLNVYDAYSITVVAWLDKVVRVDQNYISMSDFLSFMQKENIMETPLYMIRCSIIQHIIGMKEYNIIKKRINYYTSNRSVEAPIPKEGCFEDVFRHFISHKPNPYYYDHKPYNRNISDYNSTLVNVRKRFGYSYRPTKESTNTLKSAHSLRSLKVKSNSSNLLVTISNHINSNRLSNHNSGTANKLSSTISDHYRFMYNHESIIKKSTVVPVCETSANN